MKDLIKSFLELVALLSILAGLTYFQYWKAGEDNITDERIKR